MLKLAAPFAALLALGIIQTGCGPSVTYESTVNPKTSDFFVCSYWEDMDQDGEASYEEWVGVRDTFRLPERITLVATVEDKEGSVLVFRLRDSDGQMVTDVADTVYQETFVRKYSYESNYFYRHGGTGKYSAEWYLDGTLIRRLQFYVVS